MVNAKKITGKYRTNSIKVFYVNNEEIENEVNQWLEVNDKYIDVVDIKISEGQTKTIILIHYKMKEAKNQ